MTLKYLVISMQFVSTFALAALTIPTPSTPREAPPMEFRCSDDPIPMPPGTPPPPPTAAHKERGQLLKEGLAGSGPLLESFSQSVRDLTFVEASSVTPKLVGEVIHKIDLGRYTCSAFDVFDQETGAEQSVLPKLKMAVAAYFLQPTYDADISSLHSWELKSAFSEKVLAQERSKWSHLLGPDVTVGLGMADTNKPFDESNLGFAFFVHTQAAADAVKATLGTSIRGLPIGIMLMKELPRTN